MSLLKSIRDLKLSITCAALFLSLFSAQLSAQYSVETINTPQDFNLEVGGMDFAFGDNNKLLMCTRTGDVYAYDIAKNKWSIFAQGLQESLGLVKGDKPGEVYVLQRSELTRLVDENLDGRADLYERFGSGWDYHGSYHEYAFGLVRDSKGHFYGNLGLPFYKKSPFQSKWLGTNKARYRGWHFRVTKDGVFEPLAPGVRAPNGICINDQDDIFTTDNQGSFIATSVLMHATKGDFLGHPDGLIWDKSVQNLDELKKDISRQKLNKMRKRPAVYMPFPTLGRSVSSPVFCNTDQFGPYKGQLFVGDVIDALIMRIQLEKVGGEYQGSVVAHIKGGKGKRKDKGVPSNSLAKGVNRLIFDDKGQLWAGLTNRGWAAGQKGLQKITFGGKVEQAIHAITLEKNGFRMHFTKPVNSANSSQFEINRWQYEYTHGYTAKTINKSQVEPAAISMTKDRKSVLIQVNPSDLKTDFIYGIKAKSFGLKFDTGYYTLNRLK